MSIVFRFVDNDDIVQERFFDLIHVKNTKALTLKKESSYVFSSYGSDVQNLRGQGYDGACKHFFSKNALMHIITDFGI
jgi:hypothetical protein